MNSPNSSLTAVTACFPHQNSERNWEASNCVPNIGKFCPDNKTIIIFSEASFVLFVVCSGSFFPLVSVQADMNSFNPINSQDKSVSKGLRPSSLNIVNIAEKWCSLCGEQKRNPFVLLTCGHCNGTMTLNHVYWQGEAKATGRLIWCEYCLTRHSAWSFGAGKICLCSTIKLCPPFLENPRIGL